MTPSREWLRVSIESDWPGESERAWGFVRAIDLGSLYGRFEALRLASPGARLRLEVGPAGTFPAGQVPPRGGSIFASIEELLAGRADSSKADYLQRTRNLS